MDILRFLPHILYRYQFHGLPKEETLNALRFSLHQLRSTPGFIRNVKSTKGIVSKKEASEKILFILGAGESINRINPQQWDAIKQNHSFGQGSFLMHDFTPNFGYIELPYHGCEQTMRMWNEVYAQRVAFHRSQTRFIINLRNYHMTENHEFKQALGADAVFYLNPIYLRKLDKKYLVRFMELCHALRSDYFIVHTAGSLSLIIQLAAIWGYKQVVLIGYDGDTRYFTEDPEQIAANPHYSLFNKMYGNLVAQSRWQSGKVHTTLRSRPWSYSQLEFLEAFSSVYQNKDFRVSLGSPSSLESVFPTFDWKTAI